MVRATSPAAEVPIDAPLVRRLLQDQFPEWSRLPVVPAAESTGWDNVIYRLGTDLAVRHPLRAFGADQTEKEHMAPVADMSQAARTLAQFIRDMQAIDPAGGPASKSRGGTLADRDPVSQASAAALRDSLDVRPILEAWEAAVAEPAWTGTPVWMHGDLHPANLLVSDGELTGVIDFGLVGVGDPACDLMVAWTYLSAEARQVFRDALAVDDATWARGRGWALHLGLMAAAALSDSTVLGGIGRYTIAEVLSDA